VWFSHLFISRPMSVVKPRGRGAGSKIMRNKRRERRDYYKKWMADLRGQAIASLGGKCRRCGTSGGESNPLEFHHVVKEPNSGRQTYYIIKEVFAHPERFMLLCRRHHLDTHVRMLRQYGTMDPTQAMDIKAAMSIKANMIKVRGRGARGDSLRRHWPGMD
jgi:5-methylcytosine-specific restriction endonuclease McrA